MPAGRLTTTPTTVLAAAMRPSVPSSTPRLEMNRGSAGFLLMVVLKMASPPMRQRRRRGRTGASLVGGGQEVHQHGLRLDVGRARRPWPSALHGGLPVGPALLGGLDARSGRGKPCSAHSSAPAVHEDRIGRRWCARDSGQWRRVRRLAAGVALGRRCSHGIAAGRRRCVRPGGGWPSAAGARRGGCAAGDPAAGQTSAARAASSQNKIGSAFLMHISSTQTEGFSGRRAGPKTPR